MYKPISSNTSTTLLLLLLLLLMLLIRNLGPAHVSPEVEATPEVEAGLHLHPAECGLGRPLLLLLLLKLLGVQGAAVGDLHREGLDRLVLHLTPNSTAFSEVES